MIDSLLAGADSLGAITTEQMDLLPTQALTSLANTAASLKSQAGTQLAQVNTRAGKLSGEASLTVPDMGKMSAKSFASLDSVKDSAEQLNGPITATHDLMQGALDAGEDVFSNLTL